MSNEIDGNLIGKWMQSNRIKSNQTIQMKFKNKCKCVLARIEALLSNAIRLIH